jgi:hypothetical protein
MMATALYLSKSQAAEYIDIRVIDFEWLVAMGFLPKAERGLLVERWNSSALRATLLSYGCEQA